MIHWMAWQVGTGTVDDPIPYEVGFINSVNHNFRSINWGLNATCFLADMQTFIGVDTAALRYRNLSLTGVQVKVEEEKSKDAETAHAGETVGYLVLEAQK